MTETADFNLSPGKVVGDNFPTNFVLESSMNNAAKAINRLHEKGFEVYWSNEAFTAAGKSFPEGTIMIPSGSKEISKTVKEIAEELNLTVYGSAELIDVKSRKINLPQLALYHP